MTSALTDTVSDKSRWTCTTFHKSYIYLKQQNSLYSSGQIASIGDRFKTKFTEHEIKQMYWITRWTFKKCTFLQMLYVHGLRSSLRVQDSRLSCAATFDNWDVYNFWNIIHFHRLLSLTVQGVRDFIRIIHSITPWIPEGLGSSDHISLMPLMTLMY